MALENVSKEIEMDPMEKQEHITYIAAHYGSLAFMYAKHAFQGTRPISLVPERLRADVEIVLVYVKEHNLTQVFE